MWSGISNDFSTVLFTNSYKHLSLLSKLENRIAKERDVKLEPRNSYCQDSPKCQINTRQIELYSETTFQRPVTLIKIHITLSTQMSNCVICMYLPDRDFGFLGNICSESGFGHKKM